MARPARSLVSRCVASSSRTRPLTNLPKPTVTQCLQFHSSTPRSKRRSQFRNVKASELGLTKPERMEEYQRDKFPELTPEQREQWRQKYTPEQLAALESGEQAVDPKDIIWQGRLRDDMFRPEYIDDYATVDPRYDLKPEMETRAEESDFPDEEQFIDQLYQKMLRLSDKTSTDQMSLAMLRALRAVKQSKGEDSIDLTFEELDRMEKDPELMRKHLIEDEIVDEHEAEGDPEAHPDQFMSRARALEVEEAIQQMWNKEIEKFSSTDNYAYLRPSNLDIVEDAPDGAIKVHSAEQYELGKIPGVEGLYKSGMEDDPDDPEGDLTDMKRVTGLTVKEIRSLLCKTLVVRFVSNQTRLGKVRSFSVMAMAGNGNGRLGIGQAKSTDMATATATATGLAIRTMKPIRRYENRTIYGNVTAKVSGTVAELQARPPGMFEHHPPFPCAIPLPGPIAPIHTHKHILTTMLFCRIRTPRPLPRL